LRVDYQRALWNRAWVSFVHSGRICGKHGSEVRAACAKVKWELPPCGVGVGVGVGVVTGTGTSVAAAIRKRHDSMPLIIAVDLGDYPSEYSWRIVEPLGLVKTYLQMQK
jgi:hypothetical protein